MRFLPRIWALAVLAVASTAAAQEVVHWQGDIERARQLAAQTNRLVLIHFVSRGCEPCARLESTVFSQPSFAQALEADFVPVKVNATDFPITAQRYGIATAPSDVVITPGGQLVCKTNCPQDVAQYTAQVRRISDNYRRVSAEMIATARPADPTASRPTDRAVAGPVVDPRMVSRNEGQSQARSATHAAGPAISTETTASGQNHPAATQSPAGAWSPNRPEAAAAHGIPTPSAPIATASQPATPLQPSVALDGHCPVQLIEGQRWTPGDRRFGAVHRGRLYFFAGPTEQQRFMRDPDHFSPMLAGHDPVLWQESGQLISGRREHGVFHDNRVFLFATEESLAKFERNPGAFTLPVEQAMRNTGVRR
jgi:YHS domain-containing protein